MEITTVQLVKLGTVYHYVAFPETQPEYNTDAYWEAKRAFWNWKDIAAMLRPLGYTWQPRFRTFIQTVKKQQHGN